MRTQSLKSVPTLNVLTFSFREEFGQIDLCKDQEEHAKVVDAFIRRQPDGVWVGLDVRELEYLGYSYSKPTIRRPIKRQISGEYGRKRLVLIGGDHEGDFFDGTETALKEEGLAALLATSPEESITDWRIIGELPLHLRDTFDQLLEENIRIEEPISTADFASVIGQSVQNTNIRLKKLHSLGLIRRWKVASPSGGRQWMNQAV